MLCKMVWSGIDVQAVRSCRANAQQHKKRALTRQSGTSERVPKAPESATHCLSDRYLVGCPLLLDCPPRVITTRWHFASAIMSNRPLGRDGRPTGQNFSGHVKNQPVQKDTVRGLTRTWPLGHPESPSAWIQNHPGDRLMRRLLYKGCGRVCTLCASGE